MSSSVMKNWNVFGMLFYCFDIYILNYLLLIDMNVICYVRKLSVRLVIVWFLVVWNFVLLVCCVCSSCVLLI